MRFKDFLKETHMDDERWMNELTAVVEECMRPWSKVEQIEDNTIDMYTGSSISPYIT